MAKTRRRKRRTQQPEAPNGAQARALRFPLRTHVLSAPVVSTARETASLVALSYERALASRAQAAVPRSFVLKRGRLGPLVEELANDMRKARAHVRCVCMA